ncbi:MAG: hypothetical protein ACHQ4F_07225 [Candidatus Dormibacteria bacterium]
MSNQVVNWIRDHSVLILAALAVVEGIISLALLRTSRHARHEMKAAQAAALESARAAALAAPGAIDPEAVLALLRQGHAPTLDNVYAMMRRREREGSDQSDDHERRSGRQPSAASGAAPNGPGNATPAGTTTLTTSQVEERLRRYER